MPSSAPSFADLLGAAQHSAVHLEMRDSYAVGDEVDAFAEFRRTGVVRDPFGAGWASWAAMVQPAVARGVVMRRARIVSEPVTDYIRYEHANTVGNIKAGEDVRWLPRHLASALTLPGNDFWLFDGKLVQFNLFTGDGGWASPPKQWSEDSTVTRLCASAFEQVWERAVPHEQYTV
ncbi:DUF6879 family protein [Streptomyces lavendulae]|uniref:DUF6879 family protein n=1 Tax=Streptomyces lavendulae TaxID=1914 RepID=UPI0024A262D0|nr:DUF6879 family protein [Streptomyces lavendulae]GLW04669.1 hypothetical protein Slala05_82990 [Streptomyces lavendulae subsp. lavendulae]